MRGKALMAEERDEILRGICENLSDRSIVTGLGRNQSVISREITRNGGRDGYRGRTQMASASHEMILCDERRLACVVRN